MQYLDRIDELQKELDEFRPYGPEYLPHIRSYYRVGLTYTSNAIEGVSYTETETKVLLEDGLTVGGKPLRDALAIVGHAKAYDYMFSLLQDKTFSIKDINLMHSMMEGGLESGKAGEYRRLQVFVTGSSQRFPKSADVPRLMDGLQKWIEKERGNIHPVEFAARLHLKLVMIHPYEDGNGRVARLAMNTSLIQDGRMLVIIPPILRSEYISSIKETNGGKNDTQFIEFICRCEIETQKEIIRLLRGSQEPEIDFSPR